MTVQTGKTKNKKNIKENHPALWSTLEKKPGFAYVISRVVAIAKTEIQAARDEGVSGITGGSAFASSIDSNLAMFNKNQPLFDELFSATGINTMGNLPALTKQELSRIGVRIEKNR